MNKKRYNNKIEKIFNKCMILMDRGYSIQYCLEKFGKYRNELEEYFYAIDKLKNIKDIKPKTKNSADILKKIYNSKANFEEPASYDSTVITPSTIPPVSRSSRRRPFLKPAIVFLTVFVLVIFSFSGTIYASKDSLPGENLYTVKRTTENIQLFFYPESRKGEIHYRFLNNRIYEASILLESNEDKSSELIEELIIEIDREYYECEKYNFFKENNKEDTLVIINDIKNRYRKKYGQGDSDTPENDMYDKTLEESKNLYNENIHSKENKGKHERIHNRKENTN